jgi:hypothetical protein
MVEERHIVAPASQRVHGGGKHLDRALLERPSAARGEGATGPADSATGKLWSQHAQRTRDSKRCQSPQPPPPTPAATHAHLRSW